MTALSANRLVFIDESFCRTGMRREHSWAPRGARAVGKRAMGHWKTVSIVGAIRIGSRPLLMTHRGAINGRVFLRFVRQRLVPWLRPGDVVVMDNLNSHKMVAVRAAIEAVGATPVYLPTYSPELNPIELLWPHLKRGVRALRTNTEEELRSVLRRLRCSVPVAHIAAWFRHCLSQAQLN
ncbi:IS630 family transposase [Sandaracinus amylolyticus]